MAQSYSPGASIIDIRKTRVVEEWMLRVDQGSLAGCPEFQGTWIAVLVASLSFFASDGVF